MKGIYIFEKEDRKEVNGCLISAVTEESFTPFSHAIDIHGRVDGDFVTSSCSKNDTYDFEVGALITLLRMCGPDKTEKALSEIYGSEMREITQRALSTVYENKIRALTEENVEFRRIIDDFNQEYSARGKTIEKLEKKVNYYKNKYDKLKKRVNSMYGYIDTDVAFCGGRACDKRYESLTELFKQLPQDIVDTAYKEAYCSQDINFRRPTATKREEMWNRINEQHKATPIVIEVKKEYVTTFLHELEKRFPEITWCSGSKIFESNPMWLQPIRDVYKELKTYECIYFRLGQDCRLSYSTDPNIPYYAGLTFISYLAPMRWDLFKKGRLIVGVRKEQYDEFVEEFEQQFGKVKRHNPYESFNYSFFIYDKRVNYITPIAKSQFRQAKTINGVKVVYWEDVR